jgi:hypothetical protein
MKIYDRNHRTQNCNHEKVLYGQDKVNSKASWEEVNLYAVGKI